VESLYLLIPLSLVLVLGIGGLLAWAVLGGQFEDLEAEGRRILNDDAPPDTSAPARSPLRDDDVRGVHEARDDERDQRG
jgi:cbb3-type cytochrome oxidase maturation protein